MCLCSGSPQSVVKGMRAVSSPCLQVCFQEGVRDAPACETDLSGFPGEVTRLTHFSCLFAKNTVSR